MITETTRFGMLQVDPNEVITVNRGLLGFPDAQKFVLVDHAPGVVFQWLQSLDDPALAFLVVDPHIFFPDYEVEISDADAEALGIGGPDDAAILTTVSIRQPTYEASANLLGPVVVGRNSHRGAQLVLNGDRYSAREALLPVNRARVAVAA